MPDLATHAITGYLLSRPAPVRKQAAWIVTGAVLPDVLNRVPTMVFSDLSWALMPLHTPFTIFLCCYALALLLPTQPLRTNVCIALIAGAATHFCLDALQRHIGPGYVWLFPFSWASSNWGVFWPEDSLRFLPVLCAVAAGVWFVENRNLLLRLVKR